jgi:hypothetical protein
MLLKLKYFLFICIFILRPTPVFFSILSTNAFFVVFALLVKVFSAHLAELVDAIDLKFIPNGCWFNSNNEHCALVDSIEKGFIYVIFLFLFFIVFRTSSVTQTDRVLSFEVNSCGFKSYQVLGLLFISVPLLLLGKVRGRSFNWENICFAYSMLSVQARPSPLFFFPFFFQKKLGFC